MGTADVVPGVSGGTVAFVLGIYPTFIAALSTVNFRWLLHLGLFVVSGFKKHHLDLFKQHFLRIHWGFLLTLLTGMLSAMVVGSAVIPGLMENYPIQMRALFLGLVMASIAVPLGELGRINGRMAAVMLVTAIGTYFLLGLKGEPPATWTAHANQTQQSLYDFSQQHPGLKEPSGIYCPSEDLASDNSALRASIASRNPELAAQLSEICTQLKEAKGQNQQLAAVIQMHGLDDKSLDPFASLEIDQGTEIYVATPALVFIFFAGAIAICAMVLPGISGSFLLLILGAYYFIFSSIRGSIEVLTGRADSMDPLVFLIVFALGVVAGVMSFSRVVTLLFERYRAITLAALIGIMAGSLRVVWPFQIGSMKSGATTNILPTANDPILMSFVLCAIGFIVVVGLAKLSAYLEAQSSSSSST